MTWGGWLADATSTYAIRRVTIDTTSWTPITTPIGCNQVVIRQGDGTNNIKARTDANDSGTEHVAIQPGVEYIINANPGSAMAVAFAPGVTVVYLQAAAGTGPAVCSFIR